MKIELSPYNPNWAIQFENEKKEISQVFPFSDFTIEHIGSTSIIDLSAKPIVDMMIGIESLAFAEKCIEVLTNLNYNYVQAYDSIMPERRFLFKEKNGIKTVHVHLVEFGSPFWMRHLFFRDYLRQNSDKKLEYENLKIELARKEWENGNEYANAKGEFIQSIDALRK